jgi:hypothetical protein
MTVQPIAYTTINDPFSNYHKNNILNSSYILHAEKKYISFSVPVLSIVRLLIDYGADVNRADRRTKSTPLHLISRCYDVDVTKSVIRLLLDANAHTDCIDRNGRLPEDYTREFEIKEFMRANRKLSLKCQCAYLIILKNVCYMNYLPSNLIAFIRMHDRN